MNQQVPRQKTSRGLRMAYTYQSGRWGGIVVRASTFNWAAALTRTLSATLLHYVVIIISNVPDRLTDSLRTHTLTTSKWQRAKQMPIWTAFTVTTLLTRRALSSDIWLDICHPCRKYSIERLTLFPHAPQLSLSV